MVGSQADGRDTRLATETPLNNRIGSDWLGLTLRNTSSGGKDRPGKMTKHADHVMRKLLVFGMPSRAGIAKLSPQMMDLWTARIIADKPFRTVTSAMANMAARAVWATPTKKRGYRWPAF